MKHILTLTQTLYLAGFGALSVYVTSAIVAGMIINK